MTDQMQRPPVHPLPAVVNAFAVVASELGRGRDLDCLLRLIAEQICELIDMSRCSAFLLDEKADVFRGRAGYSALASEGNLDARVRRLTCGGVEADRVTREILATKGIVQMPDARMDPRPVAGLASAWNASSVLGIPMIRHGEVIGLFFADDHERSRRFDADELALVGAFADLASVAITQAQLVADLSLQVETLNRQNATMRRATTIEQRLTKLAVDGASIAQIADTVAELTGKPVAVRDADNRQIASSVPPGEPARPIPPLDAITLANPDIIASIEMIRRRDRPTITGPIPSASVPHRFLVSPIRIRDEYWGRILLMEHPRRFSGVDMLVGQRAASIIAWELSAEKRATAAEWHAQAALAGDLLRGTRDQVSLVRRAEFLGHTLSDPHVVCLFSVPEDGEAGGALEARVVADAWGDAPLTAGTIDGVAVVAALDPALAPKDAVRAAARHARTVREALGVGEVRIGLSRACTSAEEYRHAYQHAVQAVRCLEVYAGPRHDQVLAIGDLGAARVLLSASDPAEVRRFAHETLGPLLRDDGQTSDVLATLATYLELERSVRQTAIELGVHENTVRYRLSRVRALTGLDVIADADAQLDAHLAVQLLRFAGRLL